MADFKTILIRKRKELGLSQKEMAEYLHVTRQAISKWENGKSMPDMATLPDVAELLGVSVDELLTGKEPEKQIVERVVEKEVVKPMPAFKILSIVLPIVMVVILASILMGIYIPRAIAKRTPPATVLPEPEPEIVYTDVFLKGKSNSEDSRFHADPIKDKAYFDLNMQYSSEYSLYITAPKGAVATLNDEVIAEFNDAETKVYTRYFNFRPWVEVNNSIIINDTTYHVVVDLTKCDEREKIEGAEIVVKQRTGFEGVVIPAHGEYYVALETDKDVSVYHYIIKSEGIKYVDTWVTRRLVDKCEKYFYSFGPEHSITDFYLPLNRQFADEDSKNFDWQIEFENNTDKDIELELEELPIEEIPYFEEINIKGDGINRTIVFKINIPTPRRLMSEYYIDDDHSCVAPIFFNEESSIELNSGGPSYREGWHIETGNLSSTVEGEVYVVIRTGDAKDMRFVIDSVDHYYHREHNNYQF